MTEFKFQLGLIFRRLSLNNMLMHITANCNESHIKLLETDFGSMLLLRDGTAFYA